MRSIRRVVLDVEERQYLWAIQSRSGETYTILDPLVRSLGTLKNWQMDMMWEGVMKGMRQ